MPWRRERLRDRFRQSSFRGLRTQASSTFQPVSESGAPQATRPSKPAAGEIVPVQVKRRDHRRLTGSQNPAHFGSGGRLQP